MPKAPPYRFKVKFGSKWMSKTANQIKVMELKLHRKLVTSFDLLRGR